jgi:hypothetical protein
MADLLGFVLEAHGALRRWPGVSALTAKLAVGWPFWRSSGSPGYSATGPWTSPLQPPAVNDGISTAVKGEEG